MQPAREQWKDWERSALRTLALGMREARERAGLSQRSLAETAGIDRGQIANLESSANPDSASRTTELPRLGLIVRLALALGIPPVQLLYPDLADEPVEVWPRVETTSFEAAQWFSGELLASDINDDETTHGSTNEKIRLSRARRSARQDLSDAVDLYAKTLLPSAHPVLTPERAAQLVAARRRRLRDVEDLMRQTGMKVDGEGLSASPSEL